MGEKRRRLFSLSRDDGEYFNNEENKIELVGCPRGGKSCLEHRSEINKRFQDSSRYHRGKDYQRSIEALQSAFTKTSELQESTCLNCAEFFRSTITQSLENIHDDLHNMSTGLFGTTRYQSSYVMARDVLTEFKKDNLNGQK